MDLLPFGELAPFKAREFVPANLDLGNWEAIAAVFDELENRVAACTSSTELEGWLLDVNELSAALDEEGSKRYIAMTCHTSVEEAKKAYLDFVENIEPGIKERMFNVAKLFVGHLCRDDLPKDRYAVLDRDWASMVDLFREENVPLETEEAKLGQQYQELMGGLTVEFQGEEKTLVQMGVYQQENDRELRQEAWELVATRRLEVADECDEFIEKMMAKDREVRYSTPGELVEDIQSHLEGRMDG